MCCHQAQWEEEEDGPPRNQGRFDTPKTLIYVNASSVKWDLLSLSKMTVFTCFVKNRAEKSSGKPLHLTTECDWCSVGTKTLVFGEKLEVVFKLVQALFWSHRRSLQASEMHLKQEVAFKWLQTSFWSPLWASEYLQSTDQRAWGKGQFSSHRCQTHR